MDTGGDNDAAILAHAHCSQHFRLVATSTATGSTADCCEGGDAANECLGPSR